MTKVYLATKAEVQAVATDVTTINTQINTATTGIDARVTALETGSAQVVQNTADIAALDTQLNDATTGLVKAVTDLDTQINEAGTGVIARLDDLEQGGTATMKFRTHSATGVYEDGEVVQKDGSLWKANSAIDGSVTPVAFAIGATGATWSPLDLVNGQSFSFSSNALEPLTHDLIDLGSASNSFKGGHFQYVNFQSASGVNEGNIDADDDSLGLFGTTELALGYGNNNKDLTFTSTGLTLNKDLTVTNGNNIKFIDGDSSNPESVSLRMDGNDLTFFGKENTSAESEIARLTYDGSLRCSSNFTAGSFVQCSGHLMFSGITGRAIRWQTSAGVLSANILRHADNRLYVSNAGNSNLSGVYIASGATSWTSTSDRRLKKNIEPLNLGLDAINKLKPVQYEWKHTESNDKIDYGFIAQEVVDVLPHAVLRGADGNDGTGDVAKSGADDDAPDAWGINYTEIIAPLVKAVQELSAKCDYLQAQLDQLSR